MHTWVTFLLQPSHFILSGTISNCPLLFPSSILDTFWPGGSSSGVRSFCLFILSMRFSRKEYWNGLPFPPPVDHVLSELFTMTCQSLVTLHSMTHSFIGLYKPLHYNKDKIHDEPGFQYKSWFSHVLCAASFMPQVSFVKCGYQQYLADTIRLLYVWLLLPITPVLVMVR